MAIYFDRHSSLLAHINTQLDLHKTITRAQFHDSHLQQRLTHVHTHTLKRTVVVSDLASGGLHHHALHHLPFRGDCVVPPERELHGLATVRERGGVCIGRVCLLV